MRNHVQTLCAVNQINYFQLFEVTLLPNSRQIPFSVNWYLKIQKNIINFFIVQNMIREILETAWTGASYFFTSVLSVWEQISNVRQWMIQEYHWLCLQVKTAKTSPSPNYSIVSNSNQENLISIYICKKIC